MGSDRARVTFDPTRMWRGVVAQQGRVSLEADVNEAEAIQAAAARELTLDAVGPQGTPGGYVVTSTSGSSSGNASGQDLSIGAGTLYLGGERLELPAAIKYSAQSDWLDSATDPSYTPIASIPTSTTNELVYLTATQQEVSAVEDPALADVAIGGPDTAQRLRILQRIRRFSTSATTCTSAFQQLQAQWSTEGYSFDSATMTLASTALLTVTLPSGGGAPTPCQPVASGGYLGAENQMYRVEIVSVDSSGTPTIAWGPDDASFIYRVQASPPGGTTTTLTFAAPPIDSYHYPQSGQAVQLLGSAVLLATANTNAALPASYVASPTGIVTTLAATYAPATQQIVLNEPLTGPIPSAYFNSTQTPQLFVRVWQGTAPAPPGQAILLNDTANGVETGVSVTLSTSSSTSGFHVGDFWRFALRPIQPAQIYPARYLDGAQPPDGPLTWAGPLATVSWAGSAPTIKSCVPSFENLVELSENVDGCCTLAVGPADVGDGPGLAQLLQQFAGQDPVTICLSPGTYTLSSPLEIGTANNGLTLKACQGGVVITGPSSPSASFQTGLIYVNGASQVAFEGIDFQPVATPFSASTTAVSELQTSDDSLIEALAGNMDVAIAITAVGASDLSVSRCTFTFPQISGNSFCVGVLGTGAVSGCSLTDCLFTDPQPPTGLQYNQIALGYNSDPPYQATYGLLLTPYAGATTSTTAAPTPAATSLHDAVVESCIFDGITIASLLVGHVGTTRFDHNVVRNCYGGIWIFTSDSATFPTELSQLSPPGTGTTATSTETSSITAYLDPLIKIAYGMGLLLPLVPTEVIFKPITGVVEEGELQREEEALQTRDLEVSPVETTNVLTSEAATAATIDTTKTVDTAAIVDTTSTVDTATSSSTLEVKPPASDAIDTGITSIGVIGIFTIPQPPSTAEVGTDVLLRLNFTDNQIDAVIEDSYTGAGLVVADQSTVAGSAVICNNRIRTRAYLGQAVMVEQVAQASLNNNLIANEAVPPATTESDETPGSCYSLILSVPTILSGPAVAITGNVLVGSVDLPSRANLDFPADPSADVAPVLSVLSSWNFLNTVIQPYAAPTTASGI